MTSFDIVLKDQTIQFDDVIHLISDQQSQICSASGERTLREWQELKIGLKIRLSEEQSEQVLFHKNSLIAGKDEHALLKEETIVFSAHAKSRIAMRIEKVDPARPPSIESILLIVKLVIESQIIDPDAEWKGYRNLTYTLVHELYNETFKVSISFEKFGADQVKVITVSNDHIDELTLSLGERPEIKEELEKLKQRLLR